MENFKPKHTLLPLYAHLSRKWSTALPFSYLGVSYTLSLGQEQTVNCIASLSYSFQETEIQFLIPDNGLCHFLEPQLEAINLKDLSEDLKAIILDTLQANIVTIFAQWKFQLTPKKLEVWEKEKLCSNLVQCVIKQEDMPVYSIFCDAQALPLNVLDSLFTNFEFVNQGNGLIFPFRLERARTHLLLQEVETLKLGDILLVDNAQTYYKFRWKNFAFQADCEGQTITVKSLIMDENTDLPAGIIPEEVPSNEEDLPEVEETQEKESVEPVSGDDILKTLPITITFIAGEQTLSLEQVKQLHNGYTFELDKTVNDSLQIFANGNLIGEGEWVQINEHLGVRITQLNLK